MLSNLIILYRYVYTGIIRIYFLLLPLKKLLRFDSDWSDDQDGDQ